MECELRSCKQFPQPGLQRCVSDSMACCIPELCFLACRSLRRRANTYPHSRHWTRIEAALELEVDHRETMRIEGGLGEVMMPVAVAEAIHMAPDLVVEVAEVIPLVILDRGIHL